MGQRQLARRLRWAAAELGEADRHRLRGIERAPRRAARIPSVLAPAGDPDAAIAETDRVVGARGVFGLQAEALGLRPAAPIALRLGRADDTGAAFRGHHGGTHILTPRVSFARGAGPPVLPVRREERRI